MAGTGRGKYWFVDRYGKKASGDRILFFPAALFRALVGQRVPERADGGISLCQTGGDGSVDCV